MTRNARIPKIDRTNRRFRQLRRLLAELADERCEDGNDFWLRSMAARAVMADVMWEDEQQRLEEACTVEPEIMVEGEKYRRLEQASSVLVHGLWGAHVVREPLYRLVGVRNGPTLKPLLRRVGVIDQSLLPDLADEAGSLMSKMTSREVEETLQRQGFRPPSRTTLRNRLGGLLEDMSTAARELEEECRQYEELDFELGAITCGLDRFATRMDETLPEGPERDDKLRARRPSCEYERTPPEPYVCNWRMAWAANVTLYDTEGRPRRSYRYGADPEYGAQYLAARMVDDIVHLCEGRRDVHVACIQDGAGDLEVLRPRTQRAPPRRRSPPVHRRLSPRRWVPGRGHRSRRRRGLAESGWVVSHEVVVRRERSCAHRGASPAPHCRTARRSIEPRPQRCTRRCPPLLREASPADEVRSGEGREAPRRQRRDRVDVRTASAPRQASGVPLAAPRSTPDSRRACVRPLWSLGSRVPAASSHPQERDPLVVTDQAAIHAP